MQGLAQRAESPDSEDIILTLITSQLGEDLWLAIALLNSGWKHTGSSPAA